MEKLPDQLLRAVKTSSEPLKQAQTLMVSEPKKKKTRTSIQAAIEMGAHGYAKHKATLKFASNKKQRQKAKAAIWADGPSEGLFKAIKVYFHQAPHATRYSLLASMMKSAVDEVLEEEAVVLSASNNTFDDNMVTRDPRKPDPALQ